MYGFYKRGLLLGHLVTTIEIVCTGVVLLVVFLDCRVAVCSYFGDLLMSHLLPDCIQCSASSFYLQTLGTEHWCGGTIHHWVGALAFS